MKRILAAAFFYYTLGKIGLLLAVPPGYASPVWPAAGFALAFVYLYGPRVLPGIWIGSFLVNGGPTLELLSGAMLARTFLTAAILATGAGVQALLGARLMSLFLGPASFPRNVRDVGLFSAVGVLSCLISPSIGALSLTLLQTIPLKHFWFHWGTWWIGDTLGVFLFTPLTWILIESPKLESRRRLYSVAVPLLVALLAVAFVFSAIHRVENQRVSQLFEQQTEAFVQSFMKSLREDLVRLQSLKSFYDSSQFVDRNEFYTFTHTSLLDASGGIVLEWIPKVSRSELPEFIEMAKKDQIQNFQLRQKNQEGKWEPSADRETYYPVYYIEPFRDNEKALGFDLGSVPDRLRSMEQATDLAAAVVTEPLIPVQFLEPEARAFLIFVPVYDGGVTPETLEQRRERLKGFVAGIFWATQRVESILKTSPAFSSIEMEIYDPGAEVMMYSNRREGHLLEGSPLTRKREMHFLGKQWEFRFYAAPSFLAVFRSGLVWGVLLVCLLFACFLQAFLIVATGHSAEVERLVDVRTAELRESLQKIEKSKIQLDEQNKMLEKVNQELDGFVYTASHDLRAPLRGVSSYASFLEEDYEEKLDTRGKDYLQGIRKGMRQMSDLIDNLLDLSRISRIQNPYEWVDSRELVQVALERFRSDIDARKVELIVQEDLPALYCDRIKMTEVFSNLIGNAIKFTSKMESSRPRIEVGFREKGSGKEFFIKDNGIGIAPEFQKRIFGAFERLHTAKDYEGTGIGLNIVKKVIEEHGGAVGVESDLGRGAIFYFSIPQGEKKG